MADTRKPQPSQLPQLIINRTVKQSRIRQPSPSDPKGYDSTDDSDRRFSPVRPSTTSYPRKFSAGAATARYTPRERERDPSMARHTTGTSSKPGTPTDPLPIPTNTLPARPFSAKGAPPLSSALGFSERETPPRTASAHTHAPAPKVTSSTSNLTLPTSKIHPALPSPDSMSTSKPPLPSLANAPDVAPAPASGMYWSKAPTSGTSHTALRAHTSTLIGSSIYVFGGCDARSCFNKLYVLDTDTFVWSQPLVHGELPLPLRAMTCTAVGKKLVIFGGGDGPAYYNDVYVLDTVNFRWTRPRIAGSPPSRRRAHTACFYKNAIYIFGGGDGVRALNDVWRLDVADTNKMRWELVSPSSTSTSTSPTPGGLARKEPPKPKARGYHTANIVASKLIVFGGSDGGECFRDVWVFNIETLAWASATIPISYPRLSHTSTVVGSYLFVIGGHDGVDYSNEVLLLNLVTMQWDKRKLYGMPMSGRGYHGAVLHDSRLYITGGFDGVTVFGDVFLLELAVHAYYSQISHFTIEV